MKSTTRQFIRTALVGRSTTEVETASFRSAGLRAMEASISCWRHLMRRMNSVCLTNPKKWQLMVILSTEHDALPTPPPGVNDETEISWLKALFEIYFDAARTALLSRQ